MSKLVLDSAQSHVKIHTFAQGLLARLAHDLELVCRDVTGTAERLSADAASARLEIPIAKIDVAGTLKGDRVDPNGLSPSDREDCLGKMCADVFHTRRGASDVVLVEATLDEGKARIRVIPPNGRTLERRVDVRLAAVGDAATRVSGRVEISLEAIGGGPVRGPMNAFRVKDLVEVLFDLVFVAPTKE